MSIIDDVTRVRDEAVERISKADSLDSLQELKVKYLGRKGAITGFLKGLKDLSKEQK
ncbi:phenylalanine--tRNA ligase subunit alpha, partial [candidate division GN15 bacterium]|nr:phenylalanine--tRNA ligase subunit alpha [candidate division GN15 bacterium]